MVFLNRSFSFINTIDIDNAYAYLNKGFIRTFGKLVKDLITLNFQNNYQYHFQTMPQDSFVYEYLFIPIIVFLVIILIYSYLKKKLLKDDKEDLESLKHLQELRDSGTINKDEFEKKKNSITSKW